MTPYQQHVARWKDCRLCPLCDQRSRIVLARGSIPCDVLFVGEAPGDSENLLGQPFVGPAGHKLDGIIAVAVPDEMSIAFTNLVACYPADSKAAGTNEPSRKEIEACRPRLEEFIQLARPRLIVAVGKLAEQYMPDTGVEVISIIHPAAILRAPLAQQAMMVRKCEVVLSNALENL